MYLSIWPIGLEIALNFVSVRLNLAIGLDLAFNFACVCGNLADLALDCLSFACVFVNLADWVRDCLQFCVCTCQFGRSGLSSQGWDFLALRNSHEILLVVLWSFFRISGSLLELQSAWGRGKKGKFSKLLQ